MEFLLVGLNIESSSLEETYLRNTVFPLTNENFVVISGCSGGGKSSILNELANRSYPVVLEPGRQIVKEQSVISGNALPWINLDKFLDLALSRYLFQYNSQKERKGLVFFDRGLIDALQINRKQEKYFENAAKNFRYHHFVFLVPPWEEIFLTDTERKHSFEAAKEEYEELLIKYKSFGYETIIIPKLPVNERVDFILDQLRIKNQSSLSLYNPKECAKRLLEWNRKKLTKNSDLQIDDLEELFAKEFVVIANERKYEANHQNYYDFLQQFRSNIESIDYQVQEYISNDLGIVMPLTAIVERESGEKEIFDAMMFLKFNESGKIVHWQEVYSNRPRA